MNGIQLEVYFWLKHLEENEAAKIVSESVIENTYQDTLAFLEIEDCIDAYNVTVKIPPKYFKRYKNNELENEKLIIENAIKEIAQKDNVVVYGISWTLKLSSDDISFIDNDIESKLINELEDSIQDVSVGLHDRISKAIKEYKEGNYNTTLPLGHLSKLIN